MLQYLLSPMLLAIVLMAIMAFALVLYLVPKRDSHRTGFGAGRFMLAIAFGLVISIAAVPSCTGGGVTEQKQIAASCATINGAVNAIAAGVETGQVSKADGQKALTLARPTAAFCEPKPADHLNPVDYAALLSAAADLATLKKEKVR